MRSVFIAISLALVSCSSLPKLPDYRTWSFADVKGLVEPEDNFLKQLQSRGPLKYSVYKNYQVTISPKLKIKADLFTPNITDRSPLVIISHGNKSTKTAHEFQGRSLASWGFNALVLSLPNTRQWLANGDRIFNLVNLVVKWPLLIGKKFDGNSIILAGHSFGGSAVTIATGKGAEVIGTILLDPAVVAKSVKKYMQKVQVPVMLLGADREVFLSRSRSTFFKTIDSPMGEISIKDAHHDDAQYPSMRQAKNFLSFDPYTERSRQKKFMASFLMTAFSLAKTGGLELAWQTFHAGGRLSDIYKNSRAKYISSQMDLDSTP